MPDNPTPEPVAQSSLRVDRGARFYKCDFQVHTPRDSCWGGEFSEITSEGDRKAYAKAFLEACRKKGLNGIAITDHHDMCLFPFVREAAAAEVKSDGSEYLPHEKLVVFPGIELTLSEPSCQAIVLFDPKLSDAALQQVWGALGVAPFPPNEAKIAEVRRLGTDKDLHGITRALGSLCANPEEADPAKRYPMKDHFILLPHVRKHGMKTLLRDGMHTTYSEMPCVGGYIEGRLYSELDESNRFILEGRNREYGYKKVAVFQTSDSREARKVTDASGEWHDFINEVRRKALEQISVLEELVNGTASLTQDERAAVERVVKRYNDHEAAYKQCVELTAKSKQQLADIERLNAELAKLGQRIGALTTQIQGLSVPPDANEPSAWGLWTEKHQTRATLLRGQCEKISGLAQDAFRATLQPCADTRVLFETLDPYVSRAYDIRKREEKVRNLCRIVGSVTDPLLKWQELVAEFDILVRSSQSPVLPETPLLISADFTEQNRKALQALKVQDVEEIRYLPLDDRIEFEFAFGTKADGTQEFIPFQDASPGQQATALMRTLLADEGPPLLIDQPEEDLDNEQIRAIAERIAETKHNRQLIFVSHNANIVVNGDAELVVRFDYAHSDRTKGLIDRTGSIDFLPIKDIITSVMEGGREAFELRRQKYGF